MRIVAWVALLLLIGLVEVDPAASQTYPSGPIRIIAPGRLEAHAISARAGPQTSLVTPWAKWSSSIIGQVLEAI